MKSTLGNIPTQQTIKSMHLKAIFLWALRSGGISRVQLTKELHLSFPSVSALVDELLEAGFLAEHGTVESSQRGRPRSLLRCVSSAFSVPVAFMTREGYHFSLFDCCGQLLETAFLPFTQVPADSMQPWQPDEDIVCPVLEKHLSQLRNHHNMPNLILCVPGSLNAKGRLTSSALQMVAPTGFLPRLERILGAPVCMTNNSDADAYAEKFLQPLPEDFIFVHVGRGVGAGIIRKGKIFTSTQMRAGEIGHISIDYQGMRCSCGNYGCLERYINILQITREVADLLQKDITFDAVAQLYRQGDEQVQKIIHEKARLLAVGISNMLAMQPVMHIVLGGSIPLLGDGFLEAVREAIQLYGFRKYMNRITVTYSQNTTGSSALGAFWNYLDHEWIFI